MASFLGRLIASLAPHPKPTPTSTNSRLRITKPCTSVPPRGKNDDLELSDTPLLQHNRRRELPKDPKNAGNDQGVRALQRSHILHAQRFHDIVRIEGGPIGLAVTQPSSKPTFKSYKNQQMPVPKNARTKEIRWIFFCGALSTSFTSSLCRGAKATVRDEESRSRTEHRGGRERTSNTPWMRWTNSSGDVSLPRRKK